MNNIFTEGSNIYLFSRPEKKIVVTKVEDFYPYFYVPVKKGKHISIFGDQAKRIRVDAPQDVARLRDSYRKTFEADVHYPNRYLIDTYKTGIIPKDIIRKQWIDIEVDSDVIPNPKNPMQKIISVTLWDSFTKMYHQFCCQKVKQDEHRKDKDTEIYLVKEERGMLDLMLEFMKKNFPDILMGWNASNFDYPYLINRLGYVYDLENGYQKFSEISPIKKAGIDTRENHWVAGCAMMDFMKMYQKITSPSGKRESYALDFIGRYELKLEKLFSDIPMKEKLGRKKYLLPYNKRDVEIMVKLDEKLNIVEYYDSVRRLSKSQFSDIYYNSAVVDNLLLSYAKGNNFILPTRKKNVYKKYAGAYVKEPEKGIHSWVADFDATGLYPNILITFNISPETLTKDGEVEIAGHHFKQQPRGMYANVCLFLIAERKRIQKEMEKYPVDSVEYDALDMAQTTLKFLINSVYGVAGYVGARLYSIGVAESVTYIGRHFAQWVGKKIEEKGYKFLYSDTDSVWSELDADNVEDCIAEGKELQESLNSQLGSFVEQFGQNASRNTLELKFENIYERMFFGGKKRYTGFLTWKKGKYVNSKEPEFKGFEVRRSDVPEIAKDFQKQFFKMILNGLSRKEVDDYIFEYINKLKKSTPEQLGFPVGTKFAGEYKFAHSNESIMKLDDDKYSYAYDDYQIEREDNDDVDLKRKKGVPIHMRALAYSKKYNLEQFQEGERIRWIYIKAVPHGREFSDVVAFKDAFPKGYAVDYERVVARLIWKKVRPIYEALTWSTSHTKKDVKIRTL